MSSHKLLAAAFLLACIVPTYSDKDDPFVKQSPPPLVGRWDLTVHAADGKHPAWLEVRQSGFRTLVGSFVGQFGSARPIAKIEYDKGQLRFSCRRSGSGAPTTSSSRASWTTASSAAKPPMRRASALPGKAGVRRR